MTTQIQKPARYYPVEQWEKIIEDWERSDLSKAAYCKKNNLPEATFRNWYLKISNPEVLKRVKLQKKTSQGKALPKSYTPEQWKIIIEDWIKSGLSRDAYCRENSIAETTFYSWRQKLSNPNFVNSKPITFRPLREWQKIIEDWEQSGISKTEYARENNVSGASLRDWSLRLKDPEFIKKRQARECLQSRYTPEQQMEFIRDWEKSGLSKAAYCLKTGVPEYGLSVWARKLEIPELAPQFAPYTETQKAPSISSFEEHFIPVTINPPPLFNSSNTTPRIDVTLSQGHRLSIQGPFNWEGLVPLLTSILRS